MTFRDLDKILRESAAADPLGDRQRLAIERACLATMPSNSIAFQPSKWRHNAGAWLLEHTDIDATNPSVEEFMVVVTTWLGLRSTSLAGELADLRRMAEGQVAA